MHLKCTSPDDCELWVHSLQKLEAAAGPLASAAARGTAGGLGTPPHSMPHTQAQPAQAQVPLQQLPQEQSPMRQPPLQAPPVARDGAVTMHPQPALHQLPMEPPTSLLSRPGREMRSQSYVAGDYAGEFMCVNSSLCGFHVCPKKTGLCVWRDRRGGDGGDGVGGAYLEYYRLRSGIL